MSIFKRFFYFIVDRTALFAKRRVINLSALFRKKLFYIVILSMLIVTGGVLGYINFLKKHKKVVLPENLISVKIIKTKKENYIDQYSVMGSIRGVVENDMRFEIEGNLAGYNFKVGDKILKGQNICYLNPKDALTKVEYAQNKYKSELSEYLSAKEKYKVYSELFGMKNLSESKLYEAKFETESAELRARASKSELELAQSNLNKTNLSALSDGILAEIIINPGEYVTPQDVVCKFIGDYGTNFEIDVPEKDMRRLAIGQKVIVISDSYSDKEFNGIIVEIAPVVKERTRTGNVKISVENKDGLLRSGMFARGTIFLKEFDNVFLIPSDSIISLNNAAFLVPVVVPGQNKDEGTVQMRPCSIGEKVGEKTIVLQGLNIGELVIVETQGQLADGVKVKFQAMDEDDTDKTSYEQ